MKVMETLEIINAEKVFLGDKDIKLMLDTDTGRVAIHTPAMMTDPVIRLDLLEEKITELKKLMER
jgi:tetrahydromethanopterin S-methyltransferase subunit B